MGITVEAVRKRITRGKLASEKGEDGTVYVWLDNVRTSYPEEAHEILLEAKDETISELRDRVGFLQRELEVWQEEARRKDHILAALTERIPELEPASELREGPQTSSDSEGGVEGRPDEEKPAQHRPWWRFWR